MTGERRGGCLAKADGHVEAVRYQVTQSVADEKFNAQLGMSVEERAELRSQHQPAEGRLHVDTLAPAHRAGGTDRVLGCFLQLRHRTPLTDQDEDFCLIEAIFPPDSRVRLHSHEDGTFFVLTGEFQGFKDGCWHELVAGRVFDVSAGVRHALRNVSGEVTHLLVATTMRVGLFLCDVGRPMAQATSALPTAAEIERIIRTAAEYGCWRGTSEDNAAVGLA